METLDVERTVDRWREHAWPAIPLASWQPTYETLHRFTQVVGKIRLGLAPPRNHWWHVPLYASARGLTTSLVPYRGGGLQLDFDFVDHRLRIATTLGETREIPLASQTVARFYDRVMHAMRELTCDVAVWSTPVEVEDRTPFELDETHCTYDPDAAARFWRALVSAQGVIDAFESRWVGKVSPTHFFWGAFDLASTRFSGRTAPEHPGAPNVARFVAIEAYSHEVSSVGFWPGGQDLDAAFYAYAYPEPAGYRDAPVEPREAFYSDALREWILPYEAVRRSRSPERMLTRFCETTYAAAATLGEWDRRALERA
ncbi:DUF5996 family protein [Sandaracinus amylolyticus]|uniref:DUF5996 family protein n=1 Tax=Sandaracinus amylolyticus TaxID=927083 RepID=UPI001F445C05|nr:DUF5996 family protein [Sandaracinus amylolyticus]UJR87151.1 Hypothetical protein I5071_92520 [Sandaracinus amylolyticus]